MRQERRLIQRVVIENFQSHAKSDLTFGPGLNAILGPSDNGKSAVLRALRWALYSEPRGTEFVRFGARECRVTVTMSDGIEIVRELLLNKAGTGGRNRYLLRRPGAEEQVFEGFGTEVPLEIIKAHGMPPIILDKDKRVMLNLGSQLEAPFLLAETGSLRARAVGRLLGVHVVDAADRGTQRDLKERKREAKTLQERVEVYTEKLQPFADLPAEEARLAEVERLMTEAHDTVDRRERLRTLRERWLGLQAERATLEGALASLQGIEEAEQRHQEALAQQQRWRTLAGLQAERNRTRAEIRQCREHLDGLERIEILAAMLVTAQSVFERRNRLAGLHERLSSVRSSQAQGQILLERLGVIDQLEPLVGEAHAAAGRLEALGRVGAQYQVARTEGDRLTAALGALQGLPEAELLVERSRGLTERQSRLSTLAATYKEHGATRNRLSAELQALEQVESAEHAVQAVQSQLERLRVLRGASDRWQEVQDRLVKGRALVAEVDGELGEQIKGYAQVLRKHETCPTCRQHVDPARIPEIIRQIAVE
ncbi:MAG TPA: AAA family ATPase [Symbiobacteriaceae bacterium]|nr:AAA family ATPase [Symbiobacteriaceae bacterium]